MATDIGVRQTLRNKGIADTDIGYDQNTGYVTVKGQNFLKPEMNVQGTTYTSQQNFDNAYNQYNKQQRANQLQSATDSYITRATQPPAANPYNDQYTKMIGDIMARVNAPQQDVYSTSQYAAAQAQADRSAKQGIRAAQEALGSSGFGRSTTLGQAANQAQNEANEYLQLQLVPQIQAQLAAERQNEIGNMYNMLSPVFNQVQRQDTLDNTQYNRIKDVIDFLDGQNQREQALTRQSEQDKFDRDVTMAGLTGNIQPYSDQIGRMNQNSQAWFNASPEEQQRLAAENQAIAAQIGATMNENGDWVMPQAQRTLSGLSADLQRQSAEIQQEGQRIANELAKLELESYPEEQRLRLQQLQRQIAQIGARAPQTATEAEMDRVRLEMAKEELNQLRSGAGAGSLDKIIQDIENSPFVSNEKATGAMGDDGSSTSTSRSVIYDSDGLKRYIDSLPVNNQQKFQLYRRFNIDTTGLDPSGGGPQELSDDEILKYLK